MQLVNHRNPLEYIEPTTRLLEVPEIDAEAALTERLQRIIVCHKEVVVQCQAPNGSFFRINTYPSDSIVFRPRGNYGRFFRYYLSQELAGRLWGDAPRAVSRVEREEKYGTRLANMVYHIVNRPPNLRVQEIFGGAGERIRSIKRIENGTKKILVGFLFIILIYVSILKAV